MNERAPICALALALLAADCSGESDPGGAGENDTGGTGRTQDGTGDAGRTFDGDIAGGLLELLRQLTDDPYVMVGAQAFVTIEAAYQFSVGYDEEFDLPTGSCSVMPTLDGKWFVTADFQESFSSVDDDRFSLWTVDGFSDSSTPGPGMQWGLYDSARGEEWSLVPKGVSFFGCNRLGPEGDMIRCETTWIGEASENFSVRRSSAQVKLTCVYAAPDSERFQCEANGCQDDNPCTVDSCTSAGCEHTPLGSDEPLYLIDSEVPSGVLEHGCAIDGSTVGLCKLGECKEDPCRGECPLEFTFFEDGESCSHTVCNDDVVPSTCSMISYPDCPWGTE